MGIIALAGGAEFGGAMAALDLKTLAAAGGSNVSVSIIPAAAAPDGNHDQAGAKGVDWFHKLGVTEVKTLPLIDQGTANNPKVATDLRSSNLIYLLGGFPEHLAASLAGSRAWNATLAALNDGAVISGSSAGAMVLCEHFYDPDRRRILPGLNLIPNSCVLPHHNTFGKTWAPELKELIPAATLIGIDEQTGLISNESGDAWRIYGGGSVVIYRKEQAQEFGVDDKVVLN